MKIYLGCRITGLSFQEVHDYLDNTEKALKAVGYEVLTPMKGKGELRTEKNFKNSGYSNPVSTDHAIFERDMWMVRQADVFYLNLLNATDFVSIGGMMELSAAANQGKHTIVAIQEGNIHRHAFVLQAADIIVDSHEAAMNYLADLVGSHA